MFVARLRPSLAALAAVGAALVRAAPLGAAPERRYTVTPLASDVPGDAPTVDPDLVNGWGLVSEPATPWWVADNGTKRSTPYGAAETKLSLVVAVDGAPTGIVFNSSAAGCQVMGGKALFIFATEAGLISGWSRFGGPQAQVMVDRSAVGAIYKGLAFATTATGSQLDATDFGNGHVDVFDASWMPVQTPGGFVRPRPAGWLRAVGIQTIGSRIFVTFAKRGGGADEVDGQGLGIVDAFDANGNLLARVAQHGQLDAPWGLALAPPAGFGRFSGDLLVGNFGDGQINAYAELPNGRFEHRGTLRASSGGKLVIDGLWALQFGHGAPANGPPNTLFFTAGPNGEADGLFGTITAG